MVAYIAKCFIVWTLAPDFAVVKLIIEARGGGLELLYYARNHWFWYFAADKYCSDCDNEAPGAVVTASSEPEPETEAGCQSHSVSLSPEPSAETQSGP